MKRFIDFVGSSLGLIILCPLFIVVGILIKREDGGPIFFVQERVGRFGRNFKIIKFRTMRNTLENSHRKITVGKDPRITGIGQFLRRYKIDEFPQLINVFKGEMSIVGPRPELPYYVNQYPEDTRAKILSVRPGITDYASLEYINESIILENEKDPERAYLEDILPQKIKYCVNYIDNQSCWLDIVLILKTIGKIFMGYYRHIALHK